jgi:hypothetical protein
VSSRSDTVRKAVIRCLSMSLTPHAELIHERLYVVNAFWVLKNRRYM